MGGRATSIPTSSTPIPAARCTARSSPVGSLPRHRSTTSCWPAPASPTSRHSLWSGTSRLRAARGVSRDMAFFTFSTTSSGPGAPSDGVAGPGRPTLHVDGALSPTQGFRLSTSWTQDLAGGATAAIATARLEPVREAGASACRGLGARAACPAHRESRAASQPHSSRRMPRAKAAEAGDEAPAGHHQSSSRRRLERAGVVPPAMGMKSVSPASSVPRAQAPAKRGWRAGRATPGRAPAKFGMPEKRPRGYASSAAVRSAASASGRSDGRAGCAARPGASA